MLADDQPDKELDEHVHNFYGPDVKEFSDEELLSALTDKQLLEVPFRIEHMSLRLNPDIAVQGIMVAMALGYSDNSLISSRFNIKGGFRILKTKRIYYRAMQAVIRTHKLDDFFDMSKDSFEVWKSFYDIFTAFLGYGSLDIDQKLAWLERALDRILNLLSRRGFISTGGSYSDSISEEVLDLLSKINPQLIKHRVAFIENLIMMLMTGHMLTISNHFREGRIEMPGKLQRTLIYSFVSLINVDLNSELGRMMIGNAVEHPEIILSIYSSIQGLFEALENGSEFEPRITSLFDNLLGPLVFLSNWQKEKSDNNVEFFGFNNEVLPEAGIERWQEFIEMSFDEVKKHLDDGVTPNGPLHKKLIQLCVAIQTLFASTTHNFENFPPHLRDLSLIYGAIYKEIISDQRFGVTTEIVERNLSIVGKMESYLNRMQSEYNQQDE